MSSREDDILCFRSNFKSCFSFVLLLVRGFTSDRLYGIRDSINEQDKSKNFVKIELSYSF